MRYYLAFSVHGTNKFRVFTSSLRKLPEGFTAVGSRRPGYDASKDGVKVHWSGLLKKDGQPHTNKTWVSRRLNQLVEMGWKEVQDKGDR